MPSGLCVSYHEIVAPSELPTGGSCSPILPRWGPESLRIWLRFTAPRGSEMAFECPLSAKSGHSHNLALRAYCRPPGFRGAEKIWTLAVSLFKEGAPGCWRRAQRDCYIMPSIPAGMADASSSFGSSATAASVVSRRLATDTAFCNAQRVTFVGSITPISTRSPNSSLAAL